MGNRAAGTRISAYMGCQRRRPRISLLSHCPRPNSLPLKSSNEPSLHADSSSGLTKQATESGGPHGSGLRHMCGERSAARADSELKSFAGFAVQLGTRAYLLSRGARGGVGVSLADSSLTCPDLLMANQGVPRWAGFTQRGLASDWE